MLLREANEHRRKDLEIQIRIRTAAVLHARSQGRIISTPETKKGDARRSMGELGTGDHRINTASDSSEPPAYVDHTSEHDMPHFETRDSEQHEDMVLPVHALERSHRPLTTYTPCPVEHSGQAESVYSSIPAKLPTEASALGVSMSLFGPQYEYFPKMMETGC
jgi:hypothetical protein